MLGDYSSSWVGIVFTALTAASASSQVFWINEFHYDNAGTDSGEFVEVVGPVSFTELASVRLTLYNGGDGSPYGSSHLLSGFTVGQQVGEHRFYSKQISGLQNGAPDGLALDLNGSVLQFLSYEGAFTASTGPAAGQTSIDIGVAESDSTPSGAALGLTGTGSGLGDFAWSILGAATPGALNSSQTLVPEPGEYALVIGGILAGMVMIRRRIRRACPSRVISSTEPQTETVS